MSFNFDKFSQEIFEVYKEIFSFEEVQELLNVSDDYNKDTPISTGKRLIIDRLYIKGEKSNGTQIDFRYRLYSGINMLIADNLKGKSSLFKIIQFALTGRDKLKHDIKKWIHEIYLGFKINEKNFTVYLQLNKSRLSGELYSTEIDSVIQNQLGRKHDPIFESHSRSDYETRIQEFFFKQFSYYFLKWTQKVSQKDKNELAEAKTSWKTYFKSIYLESRDSTSLMYGDQGKKVFQMLLGLELTYPINRLTIKKDKLQFDKGIQQSSNLKQNEDTQRDKQRLQNRLSEIDRELSALNQSQPERVNINAFYQEYENIIEEINRENAEFISNSNLIQQNKQELNSFDSDRFSNQSELSRITTEIRKTERSINDLHEFIEIGIFFSNLDIKHCPSCNHVISEKRKHAEQREKKCSLCHEAIEATDTEMNKEIYQNKIDNLIETKRKLIVEKGKLEDKVQEFQTKYSEVSASLETLESKVAEKKDLSPLKSRLRELEISINYEKTKVKPDDKAKDDLICERAVLNYQLEHLQERLQASSLNDYLKKIELLTYAIKKLNAIRYEYGERVIHHLRNIMLDEIHYLGLASITDIIISENLDIMYKQDDDFISFDDIAEGEQLRAKLAFYLSLIQLDIEHNFGRHTRFLIIDSPSKEEGDSQYLAGLSSVLKNIESRFGQKLQILIGTAERGLENVVTNQNIYPEEEFIF